jgi:hypothetical protein
MPETMNEIAKTEEVKVATPVVETAKVETPQEDLLSRVSKVKLEDNKPKVETSNPFGLTKEDYDKVQSDPTLSKFYKSMQSDYGRKTQEISELRKNYETKIADSTTWTPEKIQQVMNDKNFVDAASKVLQSQAPKEWNGTNQEWSALNDKEKQEFGQMKQELNSLRMQTSLEQQRRQDETLKQKYSDYNPEAVDIITNDLLSGKRNATREDIWKVINFETSVKQAYQLGRQDVRPELVEKQNATSMDGMNVNSQSKVDGPQKGESNSQSLKRIMLENIAKFSGQKR